MTSTPVQFHVEAPAAYYSNKIDFTFGTQELKGGLVKDFLGTQTMNASALDRATTCRVYVLSQDGDATIFDEEFNIGRTLAITDSNKVPSDIARIRFAFKIDENNPKAGSDSTSKRVDYTANLILFYKPPCNPKGEQIKFCSGFQAIEDIRGILVQVNSDDGDQNAAAERIYSVSHCWPKCLTPNETPMPNPPSSASSSTSTASRVRKSSQRQLQLRTIAPLAYHTHPVRFCAETPGSSKTEFSGKIVNYVEMQSADLPSPTPQTTYSVSSSSNRRQFAHTFELRKVLPSGSAVSDIDSVVHNFKIKTDPNAPQHMKRETYHAHLACTLKHFRNPASAYQWMRFSRGASFKTDLMGERYCTATETTHKVSLFPPSPVNGAEFDAATKRALSDDQSSSTSSSSSATKALPAITFPSTSSSSTAQNATTTERAPGKTKLPSRHRDEGKTPKTKK